MFTSSLGDWNNFGEVRSRASYTLTALDPRQTHFVRHGRMVLLEFINKICNALIASRSVVIVRSLERSFSNRLQFGLQESNADARC